MKDFHVLIVSDGTGGTASQILKAAMVQFQEDILITRYTNVRHESQIEGILRAASLHPTLVVYTLVSGKLREALEEQAERQGVEHIDLLGPLLGKLSVFFHKKPTAKPGLLHQVDQEYFARIDAIEYALAHDDGESLDDLQTADIILVGISRTSKTPLSLFLAQEGWKVANVPLQFELRPPAQLFQADQRRVVGLIIEPERLAEARRVQLSQTGGRSSYADLQSIRRELRYAREIFSSNPLWPVIDVTGKSLEEVSQEVLDQLVGRGRKL